MISILKLIKQIIMEVYIEQSQDSYLTREKTDEIDNIFKLRELNKYLGLSEKKFKFNTFEFKRYVVTDSIDDEKLCENFLAFCTNFELAPAPAILLNIFFHNHCCKTIKIIGSEINQHSENLIEYITEQITMAMSIFFD